MSVNTHNNTLYCFYDFAVSPSSFDFFTFLYSAEICRIRRGLNQIDLSLVQGPREGFREDNIRTSETNQLFFNNVILPGISFLPSIVAFRWVPRQDVNIEGIQSENLFPRGYRLEQPVSEYLAHELNAAKVRGDAPGTFVAPSYAQQFAEQYVQTELKNEPFVTLTIREIEKFDTNKTRSVNKEYWRDVLLRIRDMDVTPVVIRDTQNVFDAPFFDDIPEVSLASVHLPFRLALYEKALLNLIKANGPSVLMQLGLSHCLLFIECDNESDVISQEWFWRQQGMAVGDQYPMSSDRTRFIWNSGDLEQIVETVTRRSSEGARQPGLHPFSGKLNAGASFLLGMQHFIKVVLSGVLPEDEALLRGLQKLANDYDLMKNFEEVVMNLEDGVIPVGTVAELKQKYRFRFVSNTSM